MNNLAATFLGEDFSGVEPISSP